MRLSSEFTFEATHRIMGARDESAQLHLHTYRLTVSVEDEGNGAARMNAEDLRAAVKKGLLDRWEDATLLWSEDPLVPAIDRVEDIPREKVIYLRGNPTNDVLEREARLAISAHLPPGIRVERVTIRETPPCPASSAREVA